MKKRTQATLGNPGETRSPGQIEGNRQEQEIIDLLRSQQLDGGTAEIKRRPVNEVEFGIVGEIPVSNFSTDMVRKVFGGGDYKVQFKTAGGTYAGSTKFKIDYSIPSKYPGGNEPGRPEERADRTPEIISAVTAALKSAVAAPAPTDNSLVIELMKQNAAIVQAALASKPSGGDAAILAQLSEMKAEMRELKSSGSGRNRGGSLREALEDFHAIQEITGGGGGGDSPESGPKMTPTMQLLLAIAPAFAPLLQNFLAGAAATPGAGPSGQPALLPAAANPNPAPVLEVSPGAVAANPNPNHNSMNPLFRAYIASFKTLALTAAKKGRDAFEWADSTLDSVPANYHGQIFQLANAEDWFQKIFGSDAESTKHLQWLLGMRNGILTRALVAEVTAAYLSQPRPEPESFAPAFVDRISVSYHETLWNELEAETWQRIFAQSEIDAVWLERLRSAFEKELGEPETEIAAAAVKPEAAKAEAAKRPAGKKARGTK